MRKLFPVFTVVCLALIVSCCGKSKIPEGEINYEVTYPYMEVTGLMSAILPKEMTITFKGTKMKTSIKRGRIFATDVISDEADNSIEMRLDFGDKKYFCVLTDDEIKGLKESQPNYVITATEEADSVYGMWAKKYTVSCEDSLKPDDAWFTEDLAVQNGAWFSAYKDLVGMPVIYDVERYGMMMHVAAVSFSKREVKDDEFTRDPELEEIDFETYEKEVQELFDILLD
jgi:hypothetical protein